MRMCRRDFGRPSFITDPQSSLLIGFQHEDPTQSKLPYSIAIWQPNTKIDIQNLSSLPNLFPITNQAPSTNMTFTIVTLVTLLATASAAVIDNDNGLFKRRGLTCLGHRVI
ncbi:hypothetical protein HYALB_00007990 [Hymenoscyphus albidus]|uniref:Uncharacterized protein n=1 Tax=Hymenoscyphus albidus TaxID=595503 RepID=A0A9N9Q1P1_9HELO|nr:hypothetical protein HYALB_00007990 [Hymenoscyphus albidus]